MTTPLSDTEWRAAIPKVSLFSHLEATPSAAQWWALLAGFGGDPRVPTEDALCRLFGPTREHAREFWAWKSHTLNDLAHWTALATATAETLAAANVVYAELAVSPLDVEHHSWALPELLRAIKEGLATAPDLDARLILDVHAERGAAAVLDLVEQASTVLADGVVALHVGTDEGVLDASWAPVRERCDALGLPRISRVTGQAALAAAREQLGCSRVLARGDWAENRHLVEQVIRDRVCVLLAPQLDGGNQESAEWLESMTRDGMRFALAHPLPAFSQMTVSDGLTAHVPHTPRSHTRTWLQNAAGAAALPYQERRRLIGDLVTDPAWFEEVPSA